MRASLIATLLLVLVAFSMAITVERRRRVTQESDDEEEEGDDEEEGEVEADVNDLVEACLAAECGDSCDALVDLLGNECVAALFGASESDVEEAEEEVEEEEEAEERRRRRH